MLDGPNWRTGIQDSWTVEEIVAHASKTLFKHRGILATMNAHRAALKSKSQTLRDMAPRLGMDSEAQVVIEIHTRLAKQCDITTTEAALLQVLKLEGSDEAKSMAIHKQLDKMSDRHLCEKELLYRVMRAAQRLIMR